MTARNLSATLDAEQRVFGEVDDGHASLADFADDAVLAADEVAGGKFLREDEDRAVGGAVGVAGRDSRCRRQGRSSWGL